MRVWFFLGGGREGNRGEIGGTESLPVTVTTLFKIDILPLDGFVLIYSNHE